MGAVHFLLHFWCNFTIVELSGPILTSFPYFNKVKMQQTRTTSRHCILGELHTKTAPHLTNELASGQNWTNEFNYHKIAPKTHGT